MTKCFEYILDQLCHDLELQAIAVENNGNFDFSFTAQSAYLCVKVQVYCLADLHFELRENYTGKGRQLAGHGQKLGEKM